MPGASRRTRNSPSHNTSANVQHRGRPTPAINAIPTQPQARCNDPACLARLALVARARDDPRARVPCRRSPAHDGCCAGVLGVCHVGHRPRCSRAQRPRCGAPPSVCLPCSLPAPVPPGPGPARWAWLRSSFVSIPPRPPLRVIEVRHSPQGEASPEGLRPAHACIG